MSNSQWIDFHGEATVNLNGALGKVFVNVLKTHAEEYTMEANEKSSTELSLSDSSYDAVVAAASPELDDEPLGVSEESDYHRVSRGCPKGFTQQCGTGYRT